MKKTLRLVGAENKFVVEAKWNLFLCGNNSYLVEMIFCCTHKSLLHPCPLTKTDWYRLNLYFDTEQLLVGMRGYFESTKRPRVVVITRSEAYFTNRLATVNNTLIPQLPFQIFSVSAGGTKNEQLVIIKTLFNNNNTFYLITLVYYRNQ